MRLLCLAALFLATLASAQAPNDCVGGFDLSPKPSKCELNQLTNGEPADADKVMQNFNSLSDAIDGLGDKIEMVAPTATSSDSFTEGWPEFVADCTSDQNKLRDQWSNIQTAERAVINITGACLEPIGGMTVLGQRLFLHGEPEDDGNYYNCGATATILDDGNNQLDIQISQQGFLMLECVQLGVTEPANIQTHTHDTLRFLHGVSAGSGNLDIKLNNGGVFRSSSRPLKMRTLTLDNSSVAEIYHHLDIASIDLARGSTFNSEGAGRLSDEPDDEGGSIGSLNVRWGSRAIFSYFAHDIAINQLTASQQSVIMDFSYNTNCPQLVISTQTLKDGASRVSERQTGC